MSTGASNPNFATAYTAGNDQLANLSAQQRQLIGQLQQQAQGGQGSYAQGLINQASQQAAQNAAGVAANTPGINPGLAARQGEEAAAQGQQVAAQQGLAAQAQAQGALGNELNTAMGQGLQSQQANQSVNAQIAQSNQQASNGLIGGVLGGVGSALGAFAGAHKGGRVHMAAGGPLFEKAFGNQQSSSSYIPGSPGGVAASNANPLTSGLTEAMGGAAQGIKKAFFSPSSTSSGLSDQDAADNTMDTDLQNEQESALQVPGMKKGGKVPVLLSPGERKYSPKEALDVKQGTKHPFEVGERIPGEAPVEGDSEENDIVPQKLKAGSVVIPRTKAENAKMTKDFIQHLKDGGLVDAEDEHGFSKVLAAHQNLEKRVAQLEKVKRKRT